MADSNRNRWEERSRNTWQQGRDSRSQQYDRSRDDYSSNYGYPQAGNRYGGEDYRSETPYRSDRDYGQRRNERRDDYSDLDTNRDRSSNMGSGYDPYDYGQTVGSFNQGKEGSYRSRYTDMDGAEGRDYTDGSLYDSDYNRSYGRSGGDSYGYGSRYDSSYERNRRRDDWSDRDWDRDRSAGRRRNDRDWWDRTTDEVASWFGDEDAERRREADRRMGPHRGKGPKGYRRSDERIRDDINDRLSDDSFIDASDIDITVENSEVVLSGSVDSREEKRRAEDIAERISGVSNVENRLKVRTRQSGDGATIYRNRD